MTSESRDILQELGTMFHPYDMEANGDCILCRCAEEIKSLRQACRAMAREIERMKGTPPDDLSVEAAIQRNLAEMRKHMIGS